MLSRFEYDMRSGMVTEVFQIVYRNDAGDTLVLDKGVDPPPGFAEFTGDLNEEAAQTEE